MPSMPMSKALLLAVLSTTISLPISTLLADRAEGNTISSLMSPIVDGQETEIAGTSFGNAAPTAVWDDFEAGSPNAIINSPVIGPIWRFWAIESAPSYCDTINRYLSAQCSRHLFYQRDGVDQENAQISYWPAEEFSEAYISFWMYYEPQEPQNRTDNFKPVGVRDNSDPPGSPDNPLGFPTGKIELHPGFPLGEGRCGCAAQASAESCYENAYTLNEWNSALCSLMPERGWVRVEMYVKQESQPPHSNDGIHRIWYDGAVVTSNIFDWVGPECADGNSLDDYYFANVIFMYFHEVTVQASVCERDGTGRTNGAAFMDEVFITHGLAHLEAGNAPTWAACTHREIQPHTAWTDTSISFIAHKGALTGSVSFLYVIRSDGEPMTTAGYPIFWTTPAVTYTNSSDATGDLRMLQGTPVAAIPFYLGEDGPGALDDPDLAVATRDAPAQVFYRDDIIGGVPQFQRYDFPFGAGSPLADHRALVAAKFDRDDYSDLVLTHAESLMVFINTGGGLENRTGSFLVGQMTRGAAAVAADYNNDGLTDLFVSRDAPGQIPFTPGILYWNFPLGGRLVRDDPAIQTLMNGPCTAYRAAMWLDVDGDGDQDLIVPSYQQDGSRLFLNRRNQGTSGFEDGTQAWLGGSGLLSFVTGAVSLDYDRDGKPDLAVTRSAAPALQVMRNTGGTFEAIDLETLGAIVPDDSLASVTALDYDGNGRKDLLLLPAEANGPVRLLSNLSTPNPLLVDVSPYVGLGAGAAPGAVAQDFDGDGRPDLYFCRPASQPFYFKSMKRTKPPRYLPICLAGNGATNLDGIGAVVTVNGPEGPVSQWVECGGSASSSEASPLLYFGLVDSTGYAESVQVVWPDGRIKTIVSPPVDTLLVIQDDQDFQIAPSSVRMTIQPGVGQTDWIFEWDTDINTAAWQDTVHIEAESCECGGSLSLTLHSPGVTHEITESQGIYHHMLVYEFGCCIPDCTVTYRIASGTRFRWHHSTSKVKALKICISE